MKPNLHRCRLGKRIATTRTVGASVPARPPEWRRSAVDVRYVVLNDQVWLAQTNKVYADGKGPKYDYTPDGRLSQRIWARGIVTDYSYDGWGSLTNTVYSDGTPTVTLLYDAMGRQTNAVDAAGEGIDRLLAEKLGEATYYPLTDIQGTVWGYVDSQNSIAARWQYDAWGNVVDGEVSIPALAALRYRIQGREWSAATGLINFRMRWYDSETGRWLSKDPIGLSGGMNLYAAWRNTPLLLWDPYGLVDMNLFSRDYAISNYADRHNPAGVFSVGAHGNAQDGVLYKKSDGKYYSIPVRSLARQIRRNPRYRHQPVQLDSCNVGNGQYPQQLANLLGVEVRAPTRFVWYSSTGVEYFGETATEAPNRDDPGELISFMPNRSNYIFLR